ncbi:MAG: helix-turn-helix-type transcriptional regulator, partial [Bacteroidia bacterium]|nr:helix-turn-helix-type transcriptional regulator [Bacteroidia bacterium]
EDLKDLLRISYLYNSGYKISSIARMSRHEMNNLIDEKSSQNGPSAGFISKMLMASIDYDETKFSQILEKAIKQSGIETCILETFYPFLVRIGHLWLTNHVIPAQEHFSSYLIQNKIIDAIDRLPNGTPGENKKVIIFGLPEEFHEIPLLVALFFSGKIKYPVSIPEYTQARKQ